MSNVITKYGLRKELSRVNNNIQGYTGSNTVSYQNINSMAVKEKKIVKIKGDKVISDDGVEAPLFSPIPCVYWKCLTKPNSSGVITLKKAITGLFLINEDKKFAYCIGISGYSDEFELRIQIGTQEVRMNESFLNVANKHIIINGLEVKQQNE